MRIKYLRIHVLLLTILIICGCTSKNDRGFTRTTPWALTGSWVIGDLHTHTRFSDGALSAADLVNLAVDSGCRVLALTDHSDLTNDIATASPQYLSALNELRQRYPELIVIGGMEWNIPPYNGREHVNLLVTPSIESTILPNFRVQFDSVGRQPANDDLTSEAALTWLVKNTPPSTLSVLFYAHPSRKADDADTIAADLVRWRQLTQHMIGFEGGPGHQRSSITGSYKSHFKTIDRWDPAIAKIGGIWDSLLDRGEDIWAAIANSDYHNDKLDYPPCTFSRTHFQVPEQSQRGVLEALIAGSFWADHGHILDDLLFVVQAQGLELPATPGEAISVNSSDEIEVQLAIKRGEGARNSQLRAELISNCRSGVPELIESHNLGPTESVTSWELRQLRFGADTESCYARIRVRKDVDDGPDLLAYTNPVRIIIN